MAQLDVYPAAAGLALCEAQPRHPKNNSININNNQKDAAADGPDVAPAGLPPLLRGHPDVHLHEGVIRAFADAEADGERAFFVADLSVVQRQHERWTRCLPDVEPFFAVKSNPDPYVLRLLAALGTGFDCASHGEIAQVLQLGVAPGRVIFANPCKPASFVRAAARAGVDLLTFDNADELHKVARAHPRARLVLRVLADDSASACRLGLKFGAPLAAVPALLRTARALGLDVVGVSFHVGSGCADAGAFADAVARARAAFDMGAAAGFRFALLDVGGGFDDAGFERAAGVLAAALDAHFPTRARDGLRVIAEPGRFFVSRAFTLAANIIARRTAEEGDAADAEIMYYINDGVYGSFNCILFDHQTVQPQVVTLQHSFVGAGALAREAAAACSVWGPTCDSIDRVCAGARLPAALAVGDWLAFRNMGAYTTTAASQFNGFARSGVVYTSGVDGGAVRRALARAGGA